MLAKDISIAADSNGRDSNGLLPFKAEYEATGDVSLNMQSD